MRIDGLRIGSYRLAPEWAGFVGSVKIVRRDNPDEFLPRAHKVADGDWRTWKGGESFPTLLRLVRSLASR